MANTNALMCFAFGVAQSAGAELTFSLVKNAADGLHEMSLGPVPFLNYGFNTRSFDNRLPGPTLRMNPGETLQIDLTNNLSPDNNVGCGSTQDEFCDTSITNFHTHGLHVSSKGVEDGLSYYSDDVFAALQPTETASFRFAIPDYHLPGTHWYHPHHHHATALQVGGGAAGALIVNDPPGYLPSEYADMVEKILFISGHDIEELEEVSVSAQANLWSTATTSVDANYITLVNGQLLPTMTMESHIWHRFRMVFAALKRSLFLSIVGNAVCQWKLLAKDGIYLNTLPRDIQNVYLWPAARADVAVSCVCTTYPCEATLTATDIEFDEEEQEDEEEKEVILNLSITETVGGAVVTLPVTQLERPCYLVDLSTATVPSGNSGTLGMVSTRRRNSVKSVEWNEVGRSMNHSNVHAGGATMRDWAPLTTFQTGTVYEVTVTGAEDHPLHIHVNPFQLTQASFNTNTLGGYFQVGDWHDTLQLPGNTFTIRIHTDSFAGKAVVHCHKYKHGDKGMMGFFEVGGTEGAIWADAESIDATCYRSAWTSSAASPAATPTPTTTTTATPVAGVDGNPLDSSSLPTSEVSDLHVLLAFLASAITL